MDYNLKAWFWSNQFNVKLQIAGIQSKYTNIVTRKNKKNKLLSLWYFKNKELLSVEAINDPKSYMLGKKQISRII